MTLPHYMYGRGPDGKHFRTWEDYCISAFGEPEPPADSWIGKMIAAFGRPADDATMLEWCEAESGQANGTTLLRREICQFEALKRHLGAERDPDPEVLGNAEVDALIEKEMR